MLQSLAPKGFAPPGHCQGPHPTPPPPPHTRTHTRAPTRTLPSPHTHPSQVMSTRIYRGRAPEGCHDAGISFIAFGGAALVKSCSTWEMGSAWEHPATEPLAAKAAAAAACAKAASPRQAAAAQPSPGGSVAASPAAPAAPAPSGPDGGPDLEAGPEPDAAAQQAAAAAAAAAAADALLDDLVACVSPHCSAPILAGAAFASS